MFVYAKDAESKFLEDLKNSNAGQAFEFCTHLQFSKIDTARNELFEEFLRALQNIPNSYSAQVYICQDQDVFILLYGFMRRSFEDLLASIATDFDNPDIKNMGSTYELKDQTEIVQSICKQKFKKFQRVQKEDNNAKTLRGDALAMSILSRQDSAQISSIQMRRKQRSGSMVMIADDDDLIRTLAGSALHDDYMIRYSRDGASTLEDYIKDAPDAVFLDIGLPDMNGHDVLEVLFQIDPQAFVIMFSGSRDEKNVMRALEAGAQGFIGKPFTREKLHQHVKKSPHIESKKKKGRSYESAIR